MQSGGSKVYWVKEENKNGGIVVAFAWISSTPEPHLRRYVDLFSSLGWNILVCYADFFSAFHPTKAISLAVNVLNELLEELHNERCPVVFSAFSGGSKACMYKVYQIIMGMCEPQLSTVDSQMIQSCVSGHMYDSCPIEFSSDMGARFCIHPMIARVPGTLKVASWLARGVASGLDALFLTRFDLQCTEYWEALCASVGFAAPYLIICSPLDDVPSYPTLQKFARRLKDLGATVSFLSLDRSPSCADDDVYGNHPLEYGDAVAKFLKTSSAVFTEKDRRIEAKGVTHDEISEIICDLHEVAIHSNKSMGRGGGVVPTALEFKDENVDGSPVRIADSRTIIGGHSLLGQALFDACVPKNIEGWDIRVSSGSPSVKVVATSRRSSPFQGFKPINRSKL